MNALTRLLTPLTRSAILPIVLLGALFLYHAAHLRAWLRVHVLPNGFQNEIYHLFNALELWVAVKERSWTVVHDQLFTQYWPPLHYVASLPLLSISVSRDQFVFSNLGFLALLLFGTYKLGSDLEGRSVGLLSAAILTFFPSIYGNLRHFEPNLPLTALVTMSIWLLHRSHRFSHPRYSLAFGIGAGLTLLVDRLSGAFFLAGPVVFTLYQAFVGPRRHPRARLPRILLQLGLAALLCLLLCGYYYFNFFRLHRQEVLPQAAVGEILATGARSELREAWSLESLLFYPATLLDGQVGFALGLLLGIGLLLALFPGDRRHRLWWIWLLTPLILFTLIQKKQIYYTIPILPAFAALGMVGLTRVRQGWLSPARPGPLLIGLCLLIGVNQFMAQSWARPLLPERVLVPVARPILLDLGWLAGRSPISAAWVWPRYAQSQPPMRENLELHEILSAIQHLRGKLPDFRVEVFSEDQLFFEGYLAFFVRCAFPRAIVNGLVQSPEAFYENLRMMDIFVYVTPSSRLLPTEESIRSALRHRFSSDPLEALPLLSLLEAQEKKLDLYLSIPLEYGTTVHIYRLKGW